MDWVLIFSVMWVANGVPTTPTTSIDLRFASSELCETAATALVAEMTESQAEGANTFVRAVCVQRK